jgi:hypothetical protein
MAGQVAPAPFAHALLKANAARYVSFSACRGSQHAIEGAWMPKSLARLCSAFSLCLIALLLSGSIVHAQRSGEAGAAVYRIDPQKSDIHLLVYRDGALSTFGHNHVVSLKDLKGTIHL